MASLNLPKDRRLAELVIDFVRIWRDRQPTEVERGAFDIILFHEMLTAAHAFDGTCRHEEQQGRESGESRAVVLARIEVAGWKHLIREAKKRLCFAEDKLAEMMTLKS
jgi:hypothetical protein